MDTCRQKIIWPNYYTASFAYILTCWVLYHLFLQSLNETLTSVSQEEVPWWLT